MVLLFNDQERAGSGVAREGGSNKLVLFSFAPLEASGKGTGGGEGSI